MTHTLRAIYDGDVIRPEGTPDLPVNVPFELVYEDARVVTGEPGQWLRTAMTLNLQGPPDGAEHLHDYLNDARRRSER
ncbi:MAG TPA: hypothetical protein VNU46_04350 [Gemmatimonadaceae bacterium]|jgi:hypothetical protein|nr:hypothetical protein [Gemmatimonadaceae bacterium]